jgi:hypothetical protein
VFEFGALAFFEGVEDEFAGVVLVEDFVSEGFEDAVKAHAGRGVDAEVEIRAAAFDDHGEVFNEVELAHDVEG